MESFFFQFLVPLFKLSETYLACILGKEAVSLRCQCFHRLTLKTCVLGWSVLNHQRFPLCELPSLP